MALSRSALLSILLSAAPLVSAQECTLQFDGRVPDGFAAADFDAANDIFSPDNVFGQGLSFGQLIQIPNAGLSIFDDGTIPFEVTISDDSIFAPSADNVQTGFRRAELLPASNDGTDPSTTGVKTLHFSLMKDNARPFNLSHEYQLVFLESNDFSTNQIVLKTGTILGVNTADPDTLQLFGNVNQGNLLFSTPFTAGVFHNFGITLDFDALTTQVFYSTGDDPLEQQTDAIANDVSGQGQFHFGVLKKPTDSAGDITKDGFQEAGIDEGLIYAGIFQEDSSDGCISLSL
ncbi:hypothetical protein jhhlp_007831 [Lomentospora prolificans]|uniref:Glycoside hydrolase 131 catalytic N-terminal domain-containing protein n=1 Tax=Lomentospora prolificans TaxID=41688 RepID=A0A2N3N0P1_9PEZI|nr:hypothetical protein jhhlp_007831 [Lomentospora prolificans]